MQQTLCFYHKSSLNKLISRIFKYEKNKVLRKRLLKLGEVFQHLFWLLIDDTFTFR